MTEDLILAHLDHDFSQFRLEWGGNFVDKVDAISRIENHLKELRACLDRQWQLEHPTAPRWPLMGNPVPPARPRDDIAKIGG